MGVSVSLSRYCGAWVLQWSEREAITEVIAHRQRTRGSGESVRTSRGQSFEGRGPGVQVEEVAERAQRGLFVRSVAPVAVRLRWDGRGGQWGGWRWGSPQREGGRWGSERRASEGSAHRTAPAGWCLRAPSVTQIAPQGAGVRSRDVDIVSGRRTLPDQVTLHLEEVGGEAERGAASACFGPVSRRLGRLLSRLPKSRSWSDSLRLLRRASSNGSLLPASGTQEPPHHTPNAPHQGADVSVNGGIRIWQQMMSRRFWPGVGTSGSASCGPECVLCVSVPPTPPSADLSLCEYSTFMCAPTPALVFFPPNTRNRV